MSEVREILEELGFNLLPDRDGWRSNAIYREGDNKTALKIFNNGFWVDFVENKRGNLCDLVQLTLGFKNLEEAKEWVSNKNLILPDTIEAEEIIKGPTIFPKEVLDTLEPDYSYWLGRGISESVMKLFKGGVERNGKMKNRFVFPIFNKKDQIIGLAGRDLTNKHSIKWKKNGSCKSWCFPAILNHKIIMEKKEVYLVESIGDCLSLFEAGIENCLVTFGLDLSIPLLNYLIRVDPNKIVVALNNDSGHNKSSAGNRAALTMERKLHKYFDKRQVKVCLPEMGNDWNEILINLGNEEIKRNLLG